MKIWQVVGLFVVLAVASGCAGADEEPEETKETTSAALRGGGESCVYIGHNAYCTGDGVGVFSSDQLCTNSAGAQYVRTETYSGPNSYCDGVQTQ